MLNKSFLLDVAWRFAQSASKQIYHIIAMIVGTYLIGLDSFGQYTFLSALIITCAMVSDFGISTSISKHFSEKKFSPKELNEIVTLVLLLSLLLISGLFLYFKFFSSIGFNNIVIFIVMLSIIFCVITSILDGVNRGMMNFDTNSKANVLSSSVSSFLVYPLTYMWGLNGLVISFFLLYFLSALFLYKSMKWNYRFSLDFSQPTKDIIKYGLTIGISSLGFILYIKVDQIILGNFGFTKELGVYEIIDRMLLFVLVPFGMVAQVLAPRISRKINESYADAIKLSRKISCALLVTVIILYMPIVLIYYYGDSFAAEYFSEIIEYKDIIFIVLLVFPIRAFGVFQTQALIIPFGKAKLLMYTTLSFGLLNVFLDMYFLKLFGFIGIFYATAIVIPLNILIQTAIFNARLKVNYVTET